MAFIGRKPTNAPLTSSDLGTGIVGSTNIADGTIVNADVNSSAAIAYSKLSLANSIAIADFSATGTPSSTTFLRGDNTWGSAGATAGQVIQVVSATDTTVRTTTSNTFVTASNTLTASITPSATANKILILVSASTNVFNDTSFLTVYRGATNLGSSNGIVGIQADAGESPASFMYLDSPSTTSSTTYQVYMRTTGSGTGTIKLNGSFTPASTGSIILMEIKG